MDPSTQDCWVPVAYLSHKLSEAEQRYSVTEQELLALVRAAKHWRHWLYGATVHIWTDHHALAHILSDKPSESILASLSPRMVRWVLRIKALDMHVGHIPGVLNTSADALSRHASILASNLRGPDAGKVAQSLVCFAEKLYGDGLHACPKP